MGDAEYALAFDDVIMPVAHAYVPDLVLMSAGFDAARGDPLGGCDLTPAGYAYMTSRLMSLAGGRMVVALEGGYNLTSISRGMEAVCRVLLGQAPPPLQLQPDRIHSATGRYSNSAAAAVTSGAADSAVAAADDTISSARLPPYVSNSNCNSGNSSNNSNSSASAVPRADVFQPTSFNVEEAIEDCAGQARDDVLASSAPAASAARTIASVLHTHMRYWPVLKVKYRAYQRIYETLAASVTATTGTSPPSASGGVGQTSSVRFRPFDPSPSTSPYSSSAASSPAPSTSGGNEDDTDTDDNDGNVATASDHNEGDDAVDEEGGEAGGSEQGDKADEEVEEDDGDEGDADEDDEEEEGEGEHEDDEEEGGDDAAQHGVTAHDDDAGSPAKRARFEL